MKNKKKILVLMSGGVDSSTAAALLCRQGFEVSGVYLKLWDASSLPGTGRPSARQRATLGDPCWAQEMRDAAKVAAYLGIPFAVWDVTKEYKERVLQNFYAEYAAGRTPNPDVLCNSEIKFGIALERALRLGYDYVATGHYARIGPSTGSGSKDLSPERNEVKSNGLHTAVDANKDQSYFLWRLTQEQLTHVLFPIGAYTKPQVRKLAREFGLHNWNKKDSQGVCFLGKIDLKDFLYKVYGCHPEETQGDEGSLHHEQGEEIPRYARNDIIPKPRPIVDVHGNLLGFHDGLAHFTIGQREGTRLGGGGPYYVIEKDLVSNALIVAHEKDEPEYRTVECKIQNVKCKMDGEFRCMARVRYRGELIPVTVHDDRVIFRYPARAVAPGQSIVFYNGDYVVGGGVIDRVVLQNQPVKLLNVQPAIIKMPSSCELRNSSFLFPERSRRVKNAPNVTLRQAQGVTFG